MNELYESTSVKTAGIVGNGSNVNLPGQERPLSRIRLYSLIPTTNP